MEILSREQCKQLYDSRKISRQEYESEWQKGEIYRNFLNKDCPIIFTNFWIWAKAKEYDVYYGGFKNAWQEYLTVDDYSPAQYAREQLIGEGNIYEIHQKAFNDYCKEYIKNIRGNKK